MSQADQITLSVDSARVGTADVSVVYSRLMNYLNRTLYASDSHTSAMRHTVAFFRSFATRSGNFKGVDKTSVKFTQDVLVTGVDGIAQLTAPLIVEISFSLPVGCNQASKLFVQQCAAAALTDASIIDKLNINMMV